MQILGSSPSTTLDQQSSITTETISYSAHPLASGVSLNKRLAIAISVPICFFVLLAVVAVAIYCSRLHRPHRKDVRRRGSEHQPEDASQNPAESQNQQRPPALDANGTQPDIKAILEALKQPKTRSRSDPTFFAQTQEESQQYEQPPQQLAKFGDTPRDSISDEEGIHFSDLEDPFVDRPEDTPEAASRRHPKAAYSPRDPRLNGGSTNHGHVSPSRPEDPFVDQGDDSITSQPQNAPDISPEARNRDDLADDPGLWLKPTRKTDVAHEASRDQVPVEEAQAPQTSRKIGAEAGDPFDDLEHATHAETPSVRKEGSQQGGLEEAQDSGGKAGLTNDQHSLSSQHSSPITTSRSPSPVKTISKLSKLLSRLKLPLRDGLEARATGTSLTIKKCRYKRLKDRMPYLIMILSRRLGVALSLVQTAAAKKICYRREQYFTHLSFKSEKVWSVISALHLVDRSQHPNPAHATGTSMVRITS
ncbi:uncharacterized protein MYCFIDRAFT_196276 [Pseudocercospora fijiensis CIRAD86]|uniref:Transmembrane protein n=1 Tax=Pseudocercospora fijiensis (strain CIRAD86) TaxID=383855 RepID=M3B088_PSEFD|nr:uncharacterized protein MYCFIDRAFT_196276 [Pseudocercospora fijiensis CIRAD86]EME82823.1 hypothetical protein MYCFIDRAFT_196276 [Pseudocercospora fijiensis CIRAD86]